MATLKNHPGFWLRDDAAAAFDRAEADHGTLTVNSAGRTEAEQQGLINRWNKGGAGNRPPYLYRPANPAGASNHVKNGGAAIDIGDYAKFAQYSNEYGFQHTYPGGDVVHFDFVGGGNTVNFDQDVVNRQTFLNGVFGAGLDVDGLNGPKTKAAIVAYQKVLGVDPDGIWGPNTQAAHQAYYDAHQPATAAPAAAQYHTATPADIASLGDSRGIQKVAKLNGYQGKLDNQFGGNSQAGLQNFLNRSYGGSLAAWLRAKWGYSGNDQWGPVMSAAADRANAANWTAL